MPRPSSDVWNDIIIIGDFKYHFPLDISHLSAFLFLNMTEIFLSLLPSTLEPLFLQIVILIRKENNDLNWSGSPLCGHL